MFNGKYLALLVTLWFMGWASATAQVTVVVTKVPANTPPTDTLYLAGSFNNWDAGNKAYQFRKLADGTYTVTLPNLSPPFNFKITRGTWAAVEGDIHGGKVGDREVMAGSIMPHTEKVEIISWEDLTKVQSWDVVINHIPANTPHDAQIYVCGNFNDWQEADPNYRLTKLGGGTYGVKIPKAGADTLLFKFNRGNWLSQECNTDGRELHNRSAIWKTGSHTSINADIEAWQDIYSPQNLLIIVFLVAAALQGALLVTLLLTNADRKLICTWVLAAFILIICAAALGRMSFYAPVTRFNYPKLNLLADLIYVLYAPAVYFLVHSTLRVKGFKTSVMVFFAAGIAAQAAIMLPLLVVPDVEYGKNITSGRYETLFRVCSGLASVYNCAALFFCYRLLHPLSGAALREESYEKARIYTLVTTAYSAFLLVIWLFSDVIFALSQYLPYRSWNFQESVIDFLWLAAAGTVFLQTFMYMSYPELFHVPLVPEPELQAKALPKEELDDLKAKLDRFMRSGKPYLNARLTIEDLAEAMHLNTPTLSGLINEGYGKNFFDYINEYRIEEFIRLSGNDKYKNYTFLAVAFEAGFNSKTTFNRVFKKHTGKTPREYFGLPKDAQTAEV